MKKPSSKIREEIAKLQDALKAAETREAERIGRIALKAGLGEIEIDEAELQIAFEGVAKRFRSSEGSGKGGSNGKERGRERSTKSRETSTVTTGSASGSAGEVRTDG